MTREEFLIAQLDCTPIPVAFAGYVTATWAAMECIYGLDPILFFFQDDFPSDQDPRNGYLHFERYSKTKVDQDWFTTTFYRTGEFVWACVTYSPRGEADDTIWLLAREPFVGRFV